MYTERHLRDFDSAFCEKKLMLVSRVSACEYKKRFRIVIVAVTNNRSCAVKQMLLMWIRCSAAVPVSESWSPSGVHSSPGKRDGEASSGVPLEIHRLDPLYIVLRWRWYSFLIFIVECWSIYGRTLLRVTYSCICLPASISADTR